MKLAATLPAADFVATHLLAGYPAVCNEVEYDALRAEVAEKLALSAEDLHLIGSAKLGFSLNPDHLLKPFGGHSDLDFVVVSSQLFDEASLEMVAKAEEIALAAEDERKRLRQTKSNIFLGYLRSDQLPLSSSLSREWFPRLAGPFLHEVARRHTVRAWLFKSIAHARIFYTNHHAKVQPGVLQLLSGRGDL